jgi:hypothetical protein
MRKVFGWVLLISVGILIQVSICLFCGILSIFALSDNQQNPIHWSYFEVSDYLPNLDSNNFFHEEQFYKIASAAHFQRWNEEMEDWNLLWISINQDCRDKLGDFQNFYISFYKRDRLTHTYSSLHITPSQNYVSLQEREFYLQLFSEPDIDMSKLDISATEALNIAERNGGANLRKELNDACEISIRLSPKSGWSVFYTSREEIRPSGSYRIDPYTGTLE